MDVRRRVRRRGPSTPRTSGLRTLCGRSGSGLILALGVLSMLAIMATTFVTLMRVNTRLGRVYTDDAAAELLAQGVVSYTLAVLRDDQDRTMYKYENRDQSVGGRDSWQGMSSYSPGDSAAVTDFRMSIPGRSTDWWADEEHRYGTPASNDVWFHSASDGYVEVGLYDSGSGHRESQQASFGGEGRSFCIIDRNDDHIDRSDYDDLAAPARYYAYVSGNHDGLGDDPNYTWDPVESRWYFPSSASAECSSLTSYHYDQTGFLTFGRRCYLHPGGKLSGMFQTTGGMSWRWAAKMGVPEDRYMNLNAIGNNEMLVGNARLNNLDRRNLHAYQGDTSTAPNHLGLLSFRGYPGEYMYDHGGGFGATYNAVQYSPYQLDPYRLLSVEYFRFGTSPTAAGSSQRSPVVTASRVRAAAPEWVRQRWGDDSLPADGTDRWRIGWRKDGATYYKMPSPDHPMGDDHYFGASEALNHQNEDIIPGTSRVFKTMLAAAGNNIKQARKDYGKGRPYLSTYGCDTTLRGKIWPMEGPPYTSTAGDWRHIDVLRKINLNMLGASGPEGLDDEDRDVKVAWRNRRAAEQVRLYYMLRAMLNWTNTPEPEHEACQLVASLSDMVDRDQDETYFAAPDSSGKWALGVEKHPVINEVVVFLRQANVADYDMFRMRVELYNPLENIPWVPDADEAFDISNYVLRVGSHNYKLSDLTRYTDDPNTLYGGSGAPGKIGADGLYGLPGDTSKMTWSRFAHLGWSNPAIGIDWPSGVTKNEIEAPLKISLWKPLTGTAESNIADVAGKVETINGTRHICVDHTGFIRLVRPYGSGTGIPGPGGSRDKYIGIYRRWDPMNALQFGAPDGPDWPYATKDKSTVLWCAGWNIANYPTLGAPNVDYPAEAFRREVRDWDGTTFSASKYERRFEMNWKTPDADLPSVGWLGEVCLRNCAQDGPLTWVHPRAQEADPGTRGYAGIRYANRFESEVKLDLFKPWGKSRNLHLYDMFTVFDPMHDGIDNDGDGAIDEDDTGMQAKDLWGPEVRVYGLIDMNHASGRAMETLMPGTMHPRTTDLDGIGPNTERGRANHVSWDWHAQGPRDSIGDLLRLDDLHAGPGARLSNWPYWSVTGYVSSVNLVDTGGKHHGTGFYNSHDDDDDGITDERDERDFFFTQMANFMTTRDHALTVEIVVQITDPPYYPGQHLDRGAYKVDQVHAQKHLILLVDRSTTLRIDPNTKRCDFTGPMRVLARRWGHERK